MTFSNIGLHNLNQPGLAAVEFSLMGMGLVFCGLLIIAIYITLLPKLLKAIAKKPPVIQTDTDTHNDSEEEILLAIATALHLRNNFPDGEERITWKSHGDMESPWLVSGRIQSLNNKQQTNNWNHQ